MKRWIDSLPRIGSLPSMAAMLALAALAGLATSTPATAATVAPGLERLLADGPRPVWVFFTDKGALEDDPGALAVAAARLDERALERRRRALGAAPVGWIDLPNDPGYLRWLRDRGLEPRAQSRWLAAVSVVADADQLALLASAPFVKRVQPVSGAARRDLELAPLPRGSRKSLLPPLDYGASEAGLAQINVPAVHELGYDGTGVVVGMLDTGFDLSHEAFASLDVLGTWDFINGDGIVGNEPGDSDLQDYHGTVTLSALAGFVPGQLIGPAYGASFYLAKTEDTTQEVPAEEDYWVAGVEWLEANGVDLVSSSLAYDDWYTFDDFDGNTCVTTIAADIAASLGVAMFNSAGNYRQSTGTIAAPADGDSVIAIGAVEISGEIAGFSSPGPTADGRIKPDLCALGVDVPSVIPHSGDQYATASGTSLACPLAAGVGALLLQAHPGTSPYDLRAALRATASQAGLPDNDYGWGIIDALAAHQALGTTAAPGPLAGPAPLRFHGAAPNPFNPRTELQFALARELRVELVLLDLRGRTVRRLLTATLPAGEHRASWDGRDDRGRAVSSGVYVARLAAPGVEQRRKLVLVR